ncbi:hypothetical protein HY642_00420 [Candidatus Woesearchaeota archaeon]|nr:hypothetical protein [Candidatus Woesearchaeota archaeon]
MAGRTAALGIYVAILLGFAILTALTTSLVLFVVLFLAAPPALAAAASIAALLLAGMVAVGFVHNSQASMVEKVVTGALAPLPSLALLAKVLPLKLDSMPVSASLVAALAAYNLPFVIHLLRERQSTVFWWYLLGLPVLLAALLLQYA